MDFQHPHFVAEPPVAVICLDLDGTCLLKDNANLRIAPVVVEALRLAAERRVCWAMNSDRTTDEERQIAAKLPPHLQPVALMAIQRYVHWRRSDGYAPDIPWNTESDAIHGRLWSRITPLFPAWLAAIRERFELRRVINDGTFFGVEVDPAVLPDLHAFMANLVAHDTDISVFSNRSVSAVEPMHFNKGRVLLYVAQVLGISPDRTLAIGDYLNDLEMLDGRAAAATGCPGDACAEIQGTIRRSGGQIASQPGPDGTAEVIHAWLDRFANK